MKTQTVVKYQDATAPADPTREGYVFTGWNGSYVDVESNATAVATYEEEQVLYNYWGILREGVTASNITAHEVELLSGSNTTVYASGDVAELNYGPVNYELYAFAYPKSYGDVQETYWEDPRYPSDMSIFDKVELTIAGVVYNVYIIKEDYAVDSEGDDFIFHYVF